MSTFCRLLLIASLGVGISLPSHADSPHWTMSRVVSNATAYGLNNSAQIVGVGGKTFGTDANGANPRNIFPGEALFSVMTPSHINDSGMVVGHVLDCEEFFVMRTAAYADMATGKFGTTGVVHGPGFIPASINNAGKAVGYFGYIHWVGTSSTKATVVENYPSGLETNSIQLGTLGGKNSAATDINDTGQFVGYSDTADGSSHAFFFDPVRNTMMDMGTLGGKESSAFAINGVGQVVGYSTTAGGEKHAFISGANGHELRDLGTLTTNGAVALDVNDAGVVVGKAYVDSHLRTHAFVAGVNGSGMTDINSLLTLSGGDYFTDAVGVNDLGQIVVNTAKRDVYLLTPVPEPETYIFMVVGVGLLGFAIRRKNSADEMTDRSPGLGCPA